MIYVVWLFVILFADIKLIVDKQYCVSLKWLPYNVIIRYFYTKIQNPHLNEDGLMISKYLKILFNTPIYNMKMLISQSKICKNMICQIPWLLFRQSLSDLINCPWWQGSWDQHGAHLGTRWAPCWPHELCYLGLHLLRWLTMYQFYNMFGAPKHHYEFMECIVLCNDPSFLITLTVFAEHHKPWLFPTCTLKYSEFTKTLHLMTRVFCVFWFQWYIIQTKRKSYFQSTNRIF